MKNHSFEIEGRPRAKGRPRFRVIGNGKVIAYTDSATREFEKHVADSYDGPLFEGTIAVTIECHTGSTYVSIREYPEWDPKLRGDVDNYGKAILDGLQGKAFKNDSQVIALDMSKH